MKKRDGAQRRGLKENSRRRRDFFLTLKAFFRKIRTGKLDKIFIFHSRFYYEFHSGFYNEKMLLFHSWSYEKKSAYPFDARGASPLTLAALAL